MDRTVSFVVLTQKGHFFTQKEKRKNQDTPSSFKSGTSHLSEYPASEFFVDFLKGK